MTLGNHDFAHGVDFLRRALRDARYAVTLANAGLTEGAPLWSESLLLRRDLRDSQGRPHQISIGIFGVLPPQTIEWEPGLAHHLKTEDVMQASRRAVSSLRARGADLIIALSHGELGSNDVPRAENAAGPIASIPGVSAVIAGHTHEVVVHAPTETRAAIVKAGFGGSHLAAISLQLRGDAGEWWVDCTASEVLPAAPEICTAQFDHEKTVPPGAVERINAPIGRIARPLSSHFSLLGADAGLRLTEAALRDHVATALPDCDLPVLTALAPFRTGGRGGPDHFVHIPAGPIRRGDLSALYPFTNHVAAIELSGRDVHLWLERAAAMFTHLPPAGPEQPARPLISGDIPAFQCDMIAGLDYTIDLTAPAAFDAEGNRQPGGRIRSIHRAGRPIGPDDRFLLVTNSYRLTGGPPYAGLTEGRHCLLPESARLRVRDIIARHIAEAPIRDPARRSFFRLVAAPGTLAWLDTAPEADLTASPLPIIDHELTDTGFRRVIIRL